MSAANPPHAAAPVTYLHCPRCRLAIAQRHARLAIAHCPRCLARGRVVVELFSSPLPPDRLYAEAQPTAEGPGV